VTNGAADLRLPEIVRESGESILILYWKEWIQCRVLTRRPISDPPPNADQRVSLHFMIQEKWERAETEMMGINR